MDEYLVRISFAGTGKLPHNDYLKSPYLLMKLCALKPGFVKSRHVNFSCDKKVYSDIAPPFQRMVCMLAKRLKIADNP